MVALAVIAAMAASLTVAPIAAHASDATGTTVTIQGGSDSPTPYTLTSEGIQLPDGDVFVNGGHINIRLTNGKTASIHFEAQNWPENHPKRFYIGKSFFPWTAFLDGQGKPLLKTDGTECVEWTQLQTKDGYNEHYGEGNKPGQPPVQPPVCIGTEVPPTEEPPTEEPPAPPAPKVKTEPSEDAPVCLPAGGGTVKTYLTHYESKPVWDADKKQYTDGPWVITKVVEGSREATALECPAPPEPPVVIPPAPEPKVKHVEHESDPICDPKGGVGTITVTTVTYASAPIWDADKKEYVYGPWVKTGETTSTKQATAKDCPVIIPPAPEPKTKTKVTESEPYCDPKGESVVIINTTTYLSEPVWNAEKQKYEFGPWKVVESKSSTRPATAEECPVIPPVEPPVVEPPVVEPPVVEPPVVEPPIEEPPAVVNPPTEVKPVDKPVPVQQNVAPKRTLAATGSDNNSLYIAGGGAMLLLAGAAVLIFTMRRRQHQH